VGLSVIHFFSWIPAYARMTSSDWIPANDHAEMTVLIISA